MKFILTEFTTDKQQSVTRECVDRIKGAYCIDSLIAKVEQTGQPVEIHFQGNYDLKITQN